MKKGQGLSMNVIIIAAIALLVLVVLAVLLLRSGGKVGEGTSCDGFGGTCQANGPGGCGNLPGTYIRDISKTCDIDGYICCIPLAQ